MLKRVHINCAWLSILILAAFLRLNGLSDRPMHADEATGARILANRLESDSYAFDPEHFHGPMLSVIAEPLARIAGECNWQNLTQQTLRIGPAIAGILVVLTPLLWRRSIGDWGALSSGVLLASSPLLVYYSRMFIHESLLLLFAMITVPFVYRLVNKPTLTLALVAGAGAGLMFATKETFAISMIAWALACAIHYFIFQQATGKLMISDLTKTYGTSLLIYIAVCLFVATLFYSNGFQTIYGMGDAFKTYFIYETTDGHEKPLNYYIDLLILPKLALGTYWTEGIVSVLALGSIAVTFKLSSQRKIVIFLTVACTGHLLIYSLIRYKTPWLMLVPWAHACLLAGSLIERLAVNRSAVRTIGLILLLFGVGYQTKQSLLANGRYACDARNPYAYVPTSKDTISLSNWLAELTLQQPKLCKETIAVVGSGYWPLPWYLRDFNTIGYWAEWDASLTHLSIVFAMPEQDSAVSLALAHTHTALPRSLRAQVPITLYLRNDIWNVWIQKDSDD